MHYGTIHIESRCSGRMHTCRKVIQEVIVHLHLNLNIIYCTGGYHAVVILGRSESGMTRVIEVLVHELGHVIAAKRCGCTADHILLWPLGGLAFIGGAVKPKEQILISGSGPATHLPIPTLLETFSFVTGSSFWSSWDRTLCLLYL